MVISVENTAFFLLKTTERGVLITGGGNFGFDRLDFCVFVGMYEKGDGVTTVAVIIGYDDTMLQCGKLLTGPFGENVTCLD